MTKKILSNPILRFKFCNSTHLGNGNLIFFSGSTTPTLECPSNQIFTTDNETRKVSVRFPPPKTNVNWKFVTSEPAWAKNLTTALGRGQYEIKFTAKHPKSKRVSSCSFKIIVELKQE